MAPTNLNEVKGELLHLNQRIHQLARRRKQCRKKRMHFQRIFLLFNDLSKRKETLLKVSLLSMLLLLSVSRENKVTKRKTRSCRRHIRNSGWWETVWNTYSDKRFKKMFRVTRANFLFILGRIRHDLQKQELAEEPIPAETRLGICC